MNQASTEFGKQLRNLAARQLADYDATHPGMIFAEDFVLDESQAYALQSAVSQLRVERGEKIVGYKVGCTSPAIRQQLGIDHCIFGRLYDSERFESGCELPLAQFANLAIEGELAIELAREPHQSDFHVDRIPKCVARIFTVIELHHHVIRGKKPSAGELIANNAIHSGFVAGKGIATSFDFADRKSWDTAEISIFSNNKLVENYSGRSLWETIGSSLQWLSGILGVHGERLEAGQIVLTGSLPPLIPISEECTIRVEASPGGQTEANVRGDYRN